jgi:L-malate glycosyltransferase
MEININRYDIIHIISGDLWAGAEAQVFYTLSKLKEKNKFTFLVVLFNEGILWKKLQYTNIETIVINEKKHNGLIMLLMLTKIIHRLKPVIIHVHAFKEHILGQTANMLNISSSTMVRTFHGMSEAPKGLTLVKYVKSRIIHRIEKWFLNYGSNQHIIAVSKDLQKYLEYSYPKAKIAQIYNSIPCFEKGLIWNSGIRNEYGIERNTFWIGTTARLSEPKNLELLIDAGMELTKLGINFRISIFGEGPLKHNLQNRINQNNLQDHIRLEGFRRDILPIFASLDLFVLCSLHEGLPMSLLEAISLGVPVVCTDVGGMKEVISHNYSGILVPSNDRDKLAQAIIMLHQDKPLREKFATNAMKTVEQAFHIDSSNRKLTDLYSGILGSQ